MIFYNNIVTSTSHIKLVVALTMLSLVYQCCLALMSSTIQKLVRLLVIILARHTNSVTVHFPFHTIIIITFGYNNTQQSIGRLFLIIVASSASSSKSNDTTPHSQFLPYTHFTQHNKFLVFWVYFMEFSSVAIEIPMEKVVRRNVKPLRYYFVQ